MTFKYIYSNIFRKPSVQTKELLSQENPKFCDVHIAALQPTLFSSFKNKTGCPSDIRLYLHFSLKVLLTFDISSCLVRMAHEYLVSLIDLFWRQLLS